MANGDERPMKLDHELITVESEAVAIDTTEFNDALVARLEKSVDAYKRIVSIAIKLTTPHDWFDQNGKPYLGASGAEKIASPFVVTMGPPVRERLEREDDKGKYYIWVFQAQFSSRMLGRSIVAQGKCSSRDQFFGQVSRWVEESGERKKVTEFRPLEDVKEEDILQAAYTNLFGNGVTRLLGIRGLTWEQLALGGIQKEAVGKVEYAKGSSGGAVNAEFISEGQRKRLYAIAKQYKWTDDQLRALLKERCQTEHTNEVKRAVYEAVCKELEAGPAF